MTSALSNPYELTIDGITCQASPYANGYFISDQDLGNLNDREDEFRKTLFERYETEVVLDKKVGRKDVFIGVRVYGLKKVRNAVSSNVEEKHDVEEIKHKH